MSTASRPRARRAAWAVAGLGLALAGPLQAAHVPPAFAEPTAHAPVANAPVANAPALKDLAALDKEIEKLGAPTDVAAQIRADKAPQSTKVLLLQRALVKEAGYQNLASWAAEKADNATFLQWLMTEPQMLELYVTGGVPGGLNGGGKASHVRSIEQLMRICAHAPEDVVANNTSNRDVYRKMMVSSSLGVCDNTRLWTGTSPQADPVKRYDIIKTLRANAKQYRFDKEIFDNLPVEQMRWVFENRLTDEEIPWLANYSNWFVNHRDSDTPEMERTKEDMRLNAYTFTEYSGFTGNYNKDTFFNQHDLTQEAKGIEDHRADKPTQDPFDRQHHVPGETLTGGWAAKYRFAYDDARFPNGTGAPYQLTYGTDPAQGPTRLWMVFELGGVCGAVAKTAENISGVAGLPSAVCGQPGHAAAVRYQRINVKMPDGTTKQKLGYTIQNDVYGWFQTQAPEVNHQLCAWQEVHQEKQGDPTTKRYGAGPMILMAQDALDDWDGYVKSELLRSLAAATANQNTRLAVLEQAIQEQPFNLDNTMDKVKVLEDKHADANAWLSLADQVSQGYSHYPLALHSLMKLIEQKGGQAVMGHVESKRIEALNAATKATEDQVDQADACRTVANALLNRADSKVALFSFDGEDAGVIKLGPQFSNSSLEWEYSLDGGSAWTTVAGNKHQVKLSNAEISSITAEKDIKVRLRGLSTVNTIDITPGERASGYCVNDPERAVYLADGLDYNLFEIKTNGAWKKLARGERLPENQDLQLRRAAHGTALAGTGDAVVTLPRFSSAWDAPDAHVVPAAELSVENASAQYASSAAKRAVDGYYSDGGQIWEADRTTDPFIVVDLGRERDLAYLDVIARGYGGNGNPRKIEVSVAPASAAPAPADEGQTAPHVAPEAFRKVGEFDLSWENTAIPRYRIQLSAPAVGRYVRLTAKDAKGGTVANGHYTGTFSARELIFFEKNAQPEPQPGPQPQPDPEPDPDPSPQPNPSPQKPERPLDKPISFRDVTAATPHADDISWLGAAKITTGFSDGTFRPYDTVTRCDMAAFLYRMAGSPAYEPDDAARARFNDVDGKTPHAKEIWWLADARISAGFDDGGFHPYESVKRCDMAAFLHRLSVRAIGETPTGNASFADVSASTPHAEDILWLAGNGVSAGWGEGASREYRGMLEITRCDMAAFLHRMDQKDLA